VCLFTYNFKSLTQFRALNESLLAAAREGGQPPPLIGVDQEGGQLMAITGGATELPGNLALGATRSVEYAAATGRILAAELRALGCNLNFAPVLDVASRPENPVVGLRAFGDDPDLVADLGVALIRAMQDGGVLASAKHFPGHGNTTVDSHHAGASVDRSLEELMSLELRPFQAAFAAGLASVMTAHVHYPQLDARPATFSRAILTGLMRERLGFDGLIVTDALDMHALADTPERERARTALAAGADLPLLGHLEGQEAMVDALLDSEFLASRRRIQRVRESLGFDLPPLGVRDWGEHRRTASDMASAAITVVHGASDLPLRLDRAAKLCVVTVQTGNLTPAESVVTEANPLIAQVAWRHANTASVEIAYGADERAVLAAAERCRGGDAVVLATVNAATDPSQRRVFERLVAMGVTPHVIALRSPVDAALFPDAKAVICSYGRRSIQTEAAAAVLFGEAAARGTLPLRLSAHLVTADATETVT
jgi:beta-N-acetylhexosaminidase